MEWESRWKVKIPTSRWSGWTWEAPGQVQTGLECGVLVRSGQDDPSQAKGCQQGGEGCTWRIGGAVGGGGAGTRPAGRALDPQAGRWRALQQDRREESTPKGGGKPDASLRSELEPSAQAQWVSFHTGALEHVLLQRKSSCAPRPERPSRCRPPNTHPGLPTSSPCRGWGRARSRLRKSCRHHQML